MIILIIIRIYTPINPHNPYSNPCIYPYNSTYVHSPQAPVRHYFKLRQAVYRAELDFAESGFAVDAVPAKAWVLKEQPRGLGFRA